MTKILMFLLIIIWWIITPFLIIISFGLILEDWTRINNKMLDAIING